MEDLRINVLRSNHKLAVNKRQQQQVAEHQQSVILPQSRRKCTGVPQRKDTPVRQRPAGPGPAPKSCSSGTHYSGGVKDADFKRGPVENKKLWTPDQKCHNPEKEMKKTQAGNSVGVGASPRYALLTQVERIAELRRKNEALETQLQVLQETLQRNKADHEEAEMERKETMEDLEFRLLEKEVNEAEALSRVQQLEEALQQQKEIQDASDKRMSQMKEEGDALRAALARSNREAESIAKFQSEKKALETRMQALEETIRRNNAAHAQAEMERKNTIKDLEFQLSEKKASEAEAVSQVQQLLEALQQQQESRKDLDSSVAQLNKESEVLKAALAQTQSESGRRQLEWQEEKASLKQSLTDIQHTMEEKDKAMETRMNLLAETITILTQQMNKPKKPSVWQRLKALFKRR